MCTKNILLHNIVVVVVVVASNEVVTFETNADRVKFRSMSNRNELRNPCNVLNSEL